MAEGALSMRLHEAENRLRSALIGRVGPELTCAPTEAVAVMAALYRDERVDGCAVDEDGDMLLFQWGTHDWGEGRAFEVDCTRQFITDDDEVAPMWQLSLTLRFVPDADALACGDGNIWCPGPDALVVFERSAHESAAMARFGSRRDGRVVIRFTPV